MNWIWTYLNSSVGKKQLLALTGAMLGVFLILHLLGNLIFMLSAQKFNEYGHLLTSNPFLIPAEIGLASIFLLHIFLAVRLSAENLMARPSRYEVPLCVPYQKFTKKTMIFTGLLVLVFLVVHIATLKFGAHYTVNYNTQEIRDLHRLMLELFQNKGYSAFYLFSMLVLGFHLNHGVQSAFQTLGLNNGRWNPFLKAFSYLFAAAMAAGFSLIVIYANLQGVPHA